jgi:hypothetical protein
VVDHRSTPADLAHAPRVSRVASENLDAYRDLGAAAAVDGPDSLSPREELAYHEATGGAAGSDDDVELISFAHRT